MVSGREKMNVNESVQLPRDSDHDVSLSNSCPIFESEEPREKEWYGKGKDCGVVKEGIGSIYESSWSYDQRRQQDEMSIAR